jgi:hypothetical protein
MNKGIDVKSFREDIGNYFTKEKTRRDMIDNNVEKIYEHLREPLSIESRIFISTAMESIASFYSTVGTLYCFDEPYNGWKTIKRGMLYSYWSRKILNRQWQCFRGKIKQGFTNILYVTNHAALCLAIMPEEGLWFLDLMNQSIENGFLNWTNEDYYSIFIIRLYRKLKFQSDTPSKPKKGLEIEQPYSNFFDSWEKEDKLKATIIKLCDYHLQWNDSDADIGDHRAEFSENFATINPVEIHALKYVRSVLGLFMPEVEHELLQPPFYPIPDFVRNISTEKIIAGDDLLHHIILANQDWCDNHVICE